MKSSIVVVCILLLLCAFPSLGQAPGSVINNNWLLVPILPGDGSLIVDGKTVNGLYGNGYTYWNKQGVYGFTQLHFSDGSAALYRLTRDPVLGQITKYEKILDTNTKTPTADGNIYQIAGMWGVSDFGSLLVVMASPNYGMYQSHGPGDFQPFEVPGLVIPDLGTINYFGGSSNYVAGTDNVLTTPIINSHLMNLLYSDKAWTPLPIQSPWFAWVYDSGSLTDSGQVFSLFSLGAHSNLTGCQAGLYDLSKKQMIQLTQPCQNNPDIANIGGQGISTCGEFGAGYSSISSNGSSMDFWGQAASNQKLALATVNKNGDGQVLFNDTVPGFSTSQLITTAFVGLNTTGHMVTTTENLRSTCKGSTGLGDSNNIYWSELGSGVWEEVLAYNLHLPFTFTDLSCYEGVTDLTLTSNNDILFSLTNNKVEGLVMARRLNPVVRAIQNATSNNQRYAPGDIISLYDSQSYSLANSIAQPITDAGYPGIWNDPATKLDIQVLVGGKACALMYVSPTQINCQLPVDLPMGTNMVEVHKGTFVSNALTISVSHIRRHPALIGVTQAQ